LLRISHFISDPNHRPRNPIIFHLILSQDPPGPEHLSTADLRALAERAAARRDAALREGDVPAAARLEEALESLEAFQRCPAILLLLDVFALFVGSRWSED
jgi:hypothetical protein